MAFIEQHTNEDFYISSWKHKNPIPLALQSCSAEDFELILRLASESLLALRSSATSVQIQDIIHKHLSAADLEKAELQHRFSREIQTLKDTQAYNLDTLKTQYIHTIAELEQSKSSAQTAYQLLQQNFLQLQTSMSTNLEKSVSCSFDKQNQFYNAQVQMLEKLYKTQIESLQRSLEQYQQQTLKDQNSSLKGKQGETNFDNMVQSFTTWELSDTSKTPDSCDRLATIRGCKTLFEIKNYSYSIPKKEIDKFKRDLELHKDCPFGIFISLNTAIVGGNQEFIYAELNSNNQLLIYIQKFLQHDAETVFSVLNTFVDIAQELYNKSKNFATDASLQSKIDALKPILTHEIANVAKILNELTVHKNFLIDSITKQHSSMKHHIEKLKFTFESMFRLLFLEATVEDSGAEDTKKKRRKKKAEITPSTSLCEP